MKTTELNNVFSASVRYIGASATIGSMVYTQNDDLVSIKINTEGTEGKFFGYSVCSSIELVLLDINRSKNIPDGTQINISFFSILDNSKYVNEQPYYTTSFSRDEKSNTITINAYDRMHNADILKWGDISFKECVTLKNFANTISTVTGCSGINWGTTDNLSISYDSTNRPNFDGSETLRSAIDAIAEITGTIAYISNDNKITFKKLSQLDSDTVLALTNSDYIDLSTEKAYGELSRIEHTTELNDNVTVGVGGTLQVFKENPFLSNRTDVQNILNNILASNNGLKFYPFTMKWKGNPALDIGDRITIKCKDDSIINTYILTDTIEYNGGFIQTNSFSRGDSDDDGSSETIQEALTTTSAKIDKASNEISLLASKQDEQGKEISTTLRVNPDGVTVENANGDKVTITGDCIDAATIKAKNLNLSGVIAWGDLDSTLQSQISDSGDENPDYIKSTYIDSTIIKSPTIEGEEIKVHGSFQTLLVDTASTNVTGYMGSAKGLDASGNTTNGVALCTSYSNESGTIDTGSNYAIVTTGGVRLQAGTNAVIVTPSSVTATDGTNSVNILNMASGITVKAVWG